MQNAKCKKCKTKFFTFYISHFRFCQMPELPDLEVLKKNILKKFRGQKVVSVSARKNQSELSNALEGTKLVGITRRGKFLILAFGENETEIKQELILHLMLHGRLTSVAATEPSQGTQVLAITFQNNEDLRLNDRSFWSKFWLGVNGHLDKLGVEPDSDDFTREYFDKKVAKSRGQIKPLLMKQEFIAGMGNAYTDEALFRAKVRPDEKANKLTPEQRQSLWQAIKEVLPWGIGEIEKVVGAQILEDEDRDFMNIYRKANEPCPVCGTKIVQTKIGGRDTFYCPKCQQLNEK